ncbi:MAG: prolyl oligopeptidase family serine peptidase [Bacteroidales bacterium]|nr:prolyl oligopeptidase family serine peptidase [Bacteroidales bacterium]
MKFLLTFFLTFQFFLVSFSQENIKYQKPPKEILDLVDVPQAPWVRIDHKWENMIMIFKDRYQTIDELSEIEMRLGGLRINPKTNISSRITYYNNIKVKKLSGPDTKQVEGLPDNPRLANFIWSPGQSYMAFTNTVDEGVELWIVNMNFATATKLTEPVLNANIGVPFAWFKDGKSLLVKFIPENRKKLINTLETVSEGPTVSVSSGTYAQNKTYQDLLKNKNDEFNFEQLTLSELYKVDMNGAFVKWAPPKMYTDIDFSPDGNYVLINNIVSPFSYIVPYNKFPYKTILYRKTGEPVRAVNQVPLTEGLPKGFMAVRTGKRKMHWREDKPSSIVWAKALDNGNPEKETKFRDEIFQLDQPFDVEAHSLIKLKNRYLKIIWGNDEIAIAYDYWSNNRNTKTYIFNPSDPNQETKIFSDRNYQDKYSDPGLFATYRNQYGKYILSFDKNNLFLIGEGHTKEGQFPFVDKYNIKSDKKIRIYQSEYKDKLEIIYDIVNVKEGKLLVSIESPTEYPNYYFKYIKKDIEQQQLTTFNNPFKSIQNVYKEVIKYKRDDGLDLSGTLYLPVGYNMEKKEKMPMILWAYPTEFKDKISASQTTSNPNKFTYPFYGSVIYWLTRGYVVLDYASFPIVGEGDTEPNDTFIKQLVSNAEAAIDAVDSLGYIDRKRVAVGGHSYGAFMTANLLSHSDLFAAGIARSGAYNRTLTPFGFQNEERNYWEAPVVYNKMSPFMNADKMKTPLLLIHGDADNNTGTYPLQSERYFNALKGLGATARLVMLPKESHAYRAKESILHLLWEQDQWLEKYVKNRNLNE